MTTFYIILAAVLGIAALIALAAFACFFLAFYSPRRKVFGPEEYDLPTGRVYEPFHETMTGWQKQLRALPQEDVEIFSRDGLRLRGKYYESVPGAPIELMVHGYRGSGERDMCGGAPRAFALGRNVLIIDQRAAGRSDGHIITFGVKEKYDVADWVDYISDRFGPEQKIILTGISMGAATVMMASELPLPENVIGVLADCGFTSAPEIIKKVLRQIHLPIRPFYPLVRLGARLYGGFDPEDSQPIEAVKHARLPIIFIHGEDDDFVPCEMSRRCHDACATRKAILTVPGAGHGLAFPVAPEEYLGALEKFFGIENQ